MPSEDETLDVEGAIEKLNSALELQYRSALQFALFAGSLAGFEFQAVGDRLAEFAEAELRDARRLVEKIVALDGEPTTSVAKLRWSAPPPEVVDTLIGNEQEAIEALQDVISTTGREGRSEALEHLMEHVILRKQNQVDYLLRARRGARG